MLPVYEHDSWLLYMIPVATSPKDLSLSLSLSLCPSLYSEGTNLLFK